jgi:hypothetical protein
MKTCECTRMPGAVLNADKGPSRVLTVEASSHVT